MLILGIGGLLNDPACAVLRDGKIAAAVEQKKIARRYERGALPELAIEACLEMAKSKPEEVDCVAIVRPFAEGPESDVYQELCARFKNSRFLIVEHHLAHAASAFYASPFEDAVVLTLDRVGDFRCGARWHGKGLELAVDRELYFPDSIGDLYGRVTEFLGFQANADEHKVQWLSTSGDDRFVEQFGALFRWGDGNWPRLDSSFIDRDRSTAGGFSDRFYSALELQAGEVPDNLKSHVAAGLQRAVEAAALRICGDSEHVCIAGGVGMNALLVAALERSKNVFVQPAAGNAGTALGAILHAWHSVYRQEGRASLENLCFGPEFGAEEIKRVLENCKLRFRYMLTTDEVIEEAIRRLSEHEIVAWMHGRMEFGPRALGNRSILASPLNSYSTENLNLFIKHREPFRKFAASVPIERAAEYFDVGPNARYLATVGQVKPQHRATFESALMGDGLVRIHTVSEEDNPLYYRLLQEAGRTTGLPVLYNTSFNLFGDPLVCTPRDAARSFYSSGIDSMFVGHFLLQK